MKRMVVPCVNGEDYLIRLRIVQTPWFGVYLHDLLNPDPADPHDHPWPFISVILSGEYTEDFYPWPQFRGMIKPEFREQTWKRWSIHRMGRESAHRIKSAAPGTKSLIFVGRRSRQWGFWTEDGWVPWTEYEEERRTGEAPST